MKYKMSKEMRAELERFQRLVGDKAPHPDEYQDGDQVEDDRELWANLDNDDDNEK